MSGSATAVPQGLSAFHPLLRCRTLPSVLETASPMLGFPLSVSDLSHRPLAAAPAGNQMKTASAPGGQAQALYRQSLQEDRPVFGEAGEDSALRMTLSRGGKAVGYLDGLCGGKTPDEEQTELFDLVGRLCAVLLPEGGGARPEGDDRPEYFLSDLFSGRIRERAQIAERLRYYRLEIKFPARVLSFQHRPGYVSAAFPGQEAMQWDTLQKQLCALFPLSVVFLYGEELCMIAPSYVRFEDEETFSAQLLPFLEREELLCGVSSAQDDPGKFPLYHRQAESAIRLGLILEPEQRLFRYDRLAIFHTLELSADKVNLFSLCHPAILILGDYDREHNTVLLQTLNVYLCCRCNIAESAGCMFIHRNTMNYRMAKINELVHLDYSDANVFFHLMYSFRVLRYYSATVMQDLDLQRQRFPTLKNMELL